MFPVTGFYFYFVFILIHSVLVDRLLHSLERALACWVTGLFDSTASDEAFYNSAES